MSEQTENQNESFNIKEFLIKVLYYKYFFIASLVVFLAGAFLINKITPTVYQVSSVIGPVENRRSSLLESDVFSGLGALTESRNLENDINSLNSFSLVSETIKNLNLEIGYFEQDNKILGKPRQIYNNSPYTVSLDKSHLQPINTRFYITIIDENTYRLKVSEEEASFYNYLDNKVISENYALEIDTICRFNETVTSPYYKFAVALNRENYASVEEEAKLFFEFYHLDQITKQYLKNLTIEPVSTRATLIKVSFQGENLALTVDFLNKYLQTYLDDNLAKKNKIALNTINFIDSQISDISDSLVKSESELRDYRSINQVTDLSYQGQQALAQMTQLENERSILQVQERYYNYILDYFNKNQDIAGLAPPAAANVSDPIMNSLVLDLLAMNAERSTILSNNAEKNLFLGQLENKIKLQKQAIIENVKNNLNTLNLTQNEINYRSDKISREISRLPRTELNMVSMQRQFNLTDAIYTFLLQKRSEAAIAMASNYPDYEIFDPARSINRTYLAPRTNMNYLLGLFLALMLPSLFIILKDFFNVKITSVKDVEALIKRPVINLIYSNNHKTEAVVTEYPGSSLAESFRNLRSNLFLKIRSEKQKMIMLTSAQPMDGKSFVAFNLASSIAAVGHSTILVDCDLRRPTLHEKFKKQYPVGLSNYMVNNVSKEKIIFDTNVPHLSFIPAGPALINSSEMIEAGVLDDLIDDLKNKYEYVILDTTPVGLVSDATPMIKYATFILLVCRNNYTRKDVFNDVLNLFKANKIENFDIVYNDMDLKNSRYGRYDTYYKKPYKTDQ